MEQKDFKSVEREYIASYNYTTSQRVVAAIAVVIIICGLIALGTFLFMNLISLL